MMKARKDTPFEAAKKSQPSRIDIEGLPWPLTVPWSKSFLTSKHAGRDYIPHMIYADIEATIVPLYRPKMINSQVEELRSEIAEVLGVHLPNRFDFEYPDDIVYDYDEDENWVENPESILLQERLSASHSKYNSQVEEIIKCCAKKSVMLAHPSGTYESAVVREG
jgi:hypothetical protein